MVSIFVLLVMGVGGYLLYLALNESFKKEAIQREYKSVATDDVLNRLKDELEKHKVKMKEERKEREEK